MERGNAALELKITSVRYQEEARHGVVWVIRGTLVLVVVLVVLVDDISERRCPDRLAMTMVWEGCVLVFVGRDRENEAESVLSVEIETIQALLSDKSKRFIKCKRRYVVILGLEHHLVYAVLFHNFDRAAYERTGYAAFAPVLVHAEHGYVASVSDMLVHALLAYDDANRNRRACWYRQECELRPLMKEVAVGVDDIGFTELSLDQRHDVW